MKLEHQISQTTNLDTKVLIDRILYKMEQKKYGVINIDNNSVTFDSHYYGGLIWNFEYINRLDNGKFEVIICEDHNVVNFKYCSIPLSELLFVCFIVGICIIIGTTNNIYAPCIIALPFLGQLVFKYFNLKKIAKKMLVEIVN